MTARPRQIKTSIETSRTRGACARRCRMSLGFRCRRSCSWVGWRSVDGRDWSDWRDVDCISVCHANGAMNCFSVLVLCLVARLLTCSVVGRGLAHRVAANQSAGPQKANTSTQRDVPTKGSERASAKQKRHQFSHYIVVAWPSFDFNHTSTLDSRTGSETVPFSRTTL